MVDTSGLLAALDVDSRAHEAARAVLEAEDDPPLLSPYVLAELDYLIGVRLGAHAALRLLDDVAGGAYALVGFETTDIGAATTILRKYENLRIGLTDASVVVLAGRHSTERVLTLDERHFRALRTPNGRAFTLLPADA